MIWFISSIALAINVAELGDSNCNGTVRDTVFSSLVGGVWVGDPVQAGYAYWNAGVAQPAWPATNTPAAGKGAYLVDLALADGDSTGYYVRRCANGSTTAHGPASSLTAQWAGMQADIATIGQGPPDLFVVTFGANDSKTVAASNAYESNMAWLIGEITTAYGPVDLVIARERASNSAATFPYTYLRTTIYAAQDSLVISHGVRIADGTLCDLYDGIHWSTGGHGGGQECVANLAY